jgi:glycosyltransferase involved in cell wall biosynthesis
VYWKNFAAAIRAFAAFHSRHPRSVFEIVGEGEEAKRLHDLAAELRVSAAVRFTGWLPQKDLMEKMRASDVFLYPSLREGGGAVVVEAMACGLPVICLDHAGPGFHIHPEWGIKIAPRDPAGIVKHMDAALETLHENPAVRTAMGSAARRRAEDFYVWDRLGEKLQEIYQQALVRP